MLYNDKIYYLKISYFVKYPEKNVDENLLRSISTFMVNTLIHSIFAGVFRREIKFENQRCPDKSSKI